MLKSWTYSLLTTCMLELQKHGTLYLPSTQINSKKWLETRCYISLSIAEIMSQLIMAGPVSCELLQVFQKLVSNMKREGASDSEIKRKLLQTLSKKTTMISPRHLLDSDIPVTCTRQSPGEFMVTSPRAYRLSFSHGITSSEGISFAHKEFYEHITEASLRMAYLRIPLVRLPPPPSLCTCTSCAIPNHCHLS